MIAYVIYNKDSESEGLARQLASRVEDAQVDIELLDADSPRGVQMCDNYDILGRPAVALIRDDGSPLQIWQGADSLPTPSDVSYLAHQ